MNHWFSIFLHFRIILRIKCIQQLHTYILTCIHMYIHTYLCHGLTPEILFFFNWSAVGLYISIFHQYFLTPHLAL